MFAILMNEMNLPKIAERMNWTPEVIDGYKAYLTSNRDWYFVTGYVDDRGRLHEFSIVPAYRLKHYDYEVKKIKTDWAVIVRK